MDSWTAHTPSPNLKFESSPTESLLSTPSEMYPSLFGTDSSSAVNPLEMMTPRSYSEDPQSDASVLAGMTPAPETPSASGPGSEKKQTKKRKSWGQVLPEPKTNLPPRKRAKTEDEKEQRRVERVLRNRRAAQSSRERKRQEVEGLEQQNKQLQTLLHQAQQTNLALIEELKKFQRSSGVALRPSPVTFSHELFSSQDGHSIPVGEASSLEHLLTTIPANTTVNPASLSPTLTPVPEAEEEEDEAATAATPLADNTSSMKEHASPDATQHPAAMLCDDLQCRSAGAAPSAWLATSQQHDAFSMSAPFDSDRYVIESGLLASPNSIDLEYDYMAGDDASAFPFSNDFDINDFLADDSASNEQQTQHQSYGCAAADSSFHNPKTEVSSEDPYLQPHSGASPDGCDDGGIAVGVI
ncbi:hypothetical protein B0T26DRAFT_751393 [Lasiosphaeria miniovina]|uniref:BZIP domain-containing protein n=1 Tax=Lasiosphaeria miniovina TaxID=1954250 RepID=A0AA40DUX3_9PEZI|nr:uncharacterized protein B0T26DRAFT_751393 [Lasiosphaeria miniovina]KAK0717319.1 hypothetical protein B0T26DRAFT_751393 [Lasiosphaeria miniovina]